MIGTQFGRWTVVGDPIRNDHGEKKWLCRCECGTERYVLERTLRSGGSTSCGCYRAERAGKAIRKDLEGMIFGDLTVLRPSDKQHTNGGVWWLCQCACGELYECPAKLLVTGRRTQCGSRKHREKSNAMDITGQRFRQLVALYPTEKRDSKGSVVWHCRCDCGNETDVPYNNLLYTNMISCGCRKKAHSRTLGDHLTRVADTSLDILKSKKIPVNNTTGFRGVYLIRGKYVAKINFQHKAYYLGAFDHIEDAAEARKAAEEQLFENATSFYERWKERAELDPAWAAANPVRIQVTQKENRDFKVELFPKL